MILNDDEVKERIESPLNLLNRLRSHTQPKIPSMPAPKADDILDGLDDKIKHGSIRQKAAGILSDALNELKSQVVDLKPRELAAVIREMNQVVTSREDQDKVKSTQVIVYAPQVLPEHAFETIYVKE